MKTSFSNLDYISKCDIVKKALNRKLKYKTKIGLSKKIKFGIEIEALGTDFIRKLKNRDDVYFYMHKPAYKPKDIYDKNKWILYHEQTLFDEQEDNTKPSLDVLEDKFYYGKIEYREYLDMVSTLYDGGEITSPILEDNKKSWESIKEMIKYMKKNIMNLRINESCSTHTHFDIKIFKKTEVLYNFMILLAENEEVLTRFYCGEYINLRRGAQEWASPIKPIIKKSLTIEKNMTSNRSLIESVYSGAPTMKENSFDFWQIYEDYYKHLSSSFENRIPNGTLSPTIIQNNIMLMGFLMEYVASGKYDVERGIYRLENDKSDPFYLADMLPNDEFKLDFLTQYYKDGKKTTSKKLVKSKRNFY